jgi:hypothetical protein
LTYICNKELLYKYSKYVSSLDASHGTDTYIFIFRMRVWCLTPLSTNISVISWWWVLLVEEIGVPGENHRLAASHWQTLSHNVLWNTHRHENDIEKYYKNYHRYKSKTNTTNLLSQESFIFYSKKCIPIIMEAPSWPWSHGSWIYNYLCNQCLSPLMLWVRISIRASVQHYVIKFVSNLRQIGGFLRVLQPPPIKLTNMI